MSDLLSREPTIEVRWPQPDTAVVVLGGEHDFGTATKLARTFDELLGACTHLIVDLSTTDFLDSSTIHLLVNAKKHADATRQRFNLVLASTPIVERALEIAGVLPSLNRVHTVEDALES